MRHICTVDRDLALSLSALGGGEGRVRWGTLGAGGATYLSFPPLRVGPS